MMFKCSLSKIINNYYILLWHGLISHLHLATKYLSDMNRAQAKMRLQ